MDEARSAGLLVGVCSAATKSSAICVLESLLGKERFDVRTPALSPQDSSLAACRKVHDARWKRHMTLQNAADLDAFAAVKAAGLWCLQRQRQGQLQPTVYLLRGLKAP